MINEEIYLAVPNNSRFKDKDCICLEDVKDENFVVPNEQYLLYDDFMQLCMKEGFVPNIVAKSSQWDFLLKMVDSDFGISICSRNFTYRLDWCCSEKMEVIQWKM